jgi:benzoyl-CoA reductase/2-hydroxyglutaryl-CoA dehydratase subunit BcrC/BadD/HgdB
LIDDATTYLRAEVNRYKDWHVTYTAGIDDKILGLQEAVARQQEEAEKWRQLYSVSRHQASRALDMLNSAKVQIEVLENKLNGRQ